MSTVSRFEQRFGRPPAAVWRAPGRANLIGEHTDHNEGLAMPFAIQLEATVAVAMREDGIVRCSSHAFGDAPDITLRDAAPGADWWARVVGCVAGVRELDAARIEGADVFIDSTVPSGAGLASSAATACGVTLAAADAAGLQPDLRDVVRIASAAENRFGDVPTGTMDQLASVYGRDGEILMIDFRSDDVSSVAWPFDDVSMLLIDTGVKHSLASSGYAKRRRECEEAARELRVPSLREVERSTLDDAHLREPLASRARHVVTENERVRIVHRALVDADVVAVAECIRASHRSLRDDFEVSTHELDAVADAAERGGALGARMMGGGFGGSVLALVPNGRTADVRAEVARGAAEGALGSPTFYAAEPSPGASPVREERA